MKILFLCWRDTAHPQGGGSEVYLEEIGKRISKQNNQILWQTARYPHSKTWEKLDDITYFRKGNRITVYLWAWWYLFLGRLQLGPIGKFKPEIIVDVQNGIPFFANLFFPRKTILLVHHTHTSQWKVAGKLLGNIGKFIETKISPFAYRKNKYITVSNASAQDLVKLGVKEKNIKIIQAGINHLSSTVSSPNINPTLCVLSRLVPHKQIEDAIKAVADLRTAFPQIKLEIMGDGWWETNLKALTHKLSLDEQVTFHGYVSEAEKVAILSTSWINLLPSLKEGWGISIMEAAQLNIPTIGYSYSGGLNDSIINGETGILVNDYAGFIIAIKYLLNHTEIRKNLGDNAKNYSNNFSWEKTADSFQKYLLK